MPKIDSRLRREVQEYLRENGATKEERATVWQMVHEGYDYLSNPWFYAFDGGILMDLIAALRFDRDLQEWYDSMTPEERGETFVSHDEPLEDEDLLI